MTQPLDLDDPQVRQAVLAATVRECWLTGHVEYLFHDTQTAIWQSLQTKTRRKFFLLCSRRTGKSYLLLCRAFNVAIQKPNARILFLAPTARHASEIVTDLATPILANCPVDLRPEYKAMTKEFLFKNGSIVRLKGVNNEHSSDLRGGAADLVILDECGEMDDLSHVLNDVVMPMTMTTNGEILLATTPAKSPGHDSATIYENLAKDNCAAVFTIRDAPESHIPREIKREYLLEAGEPEALVDAILEGAADPITTTVQREYFCWWVTDSSKAVVPEFTPAKQREIVKAWQRPEFFDFYVSIDPGTEDHTGILFAYWDFLNAKLVIEDEALLRQANTQTIVNCIRAKEAQLYPGQIAFLRIADDPHKRLCADLSTMHGLSCVPARKEDSLGAINLLRNDVANGNLLIDPRCVNLVRQMRNAIWNTRATDFDRPGGQDGHYDELAALKYLCRSVSRHHNPYPPHYYVRGGKFGPGVDSYISPKRQGRRQLGLLPNTPLGHKLAKKKTK